MNDICLWLELLNHPIAPDRHATNTRCKQQDIKAENWLDGRLTIQLKFVHIKIYLYFCSANQETQKRIQRRKKNRERNTESHEFVSPIY